MDRSIRYTPCYTNLSAPVVCSIHLRRDRCGGVLVEFAGFGTLPFVSFRGGRFVGHIEGRGKGRLEGAPREYLGAYWRVIVRQSEDGSCDER